MQGILPLSTCCMPVSNGPYFLRRSPCKLKSHDRQEFPPSSSDRRAEWETIQQSQHPAVSSLQQRAPSRASGGDARKQMSARLVHLPICPPCELSLRIKAPACATVSGSRQHESQRIGSLTASLGKLLWHRSHFLRHVPPGQHRRQDQLIDVIR